MNLKTKDKENTAEQRTVSMLSVTMIVPNLSQPRRHFDSAELTALAKSISQIGILQPLIVREIENGYELIAGERRLRAAKLAGLRYVPCITVKMSDDDCAITALVENLQRQDLNFFEQAEGFRQLIERFGITQQQAAIRLGISQPAIANKMRLLKLTAAQRDIIIKNHLSERHARALLRVDENLRDEILQFACEKHLTADALDKHIDLIIKKQKLEESYRRRSAALGDVRLFFNTVEKAVSVMRLAGVDAKTERTKEEGYIQYIIKIPDK